jgi:hypothetical protein
VGEAEYRANLERLLELVDQRLPAEERDRRRTALQRARGKISIEEAMPPLARSDAGELALRLVKLLNDADADLDANTVREFEVQIYEHLPQWPP